MSAVRIDRRSFLTRTGIATLAAATGSLFENATAAEAVPFSSISAAPQIKVPADSCDCHMHIYDSRFPVAPTATLRPPDAHPNDYRRLQQLLGTTRNVVVQPSTYGTDNRVTLDAVEQFGKTARAVVVVDTTIKDEELKRFDALGARGIRFNLVQAGATTVDMIEPLAKRVHDLGWHVQIHMLGDQIAQIEALLMRVPAPLVFDHMGRIPADAGTAHPAYTTLRKLLDKGGAWIKLSGAYMVTKAGPPYDDTVALGQAYVTAAPERMVWASDWPHPTQAKDKPNDARLLDLLTEFAPDERVRNRILVDNPATLYGFS